MTPEQLMQRVTASPIRPDRVKTAGEIQDFIWPDQPQKYLPRHYDNWHWRLSTHNQAMNDCLPHSITSIMEAAIHMATGVKEELSRDHFYHHLIATDGGPAGDNGGTLRGAMRVGYHVGFCSEAVQPYDSAWSNGVAPGADADAQRRKIALYYRLKGVTSQDALLTVRRIMEAEAMGLMVLYGGELERDYFYLKGPGPFNDYMGPDKPGGIGGYMHAQVGTGYHYSQSWHRKQNSWSDDPQVWGEDGSVSRSIRGTARVPIVGDARHAIDLWAIRAIVVDGVTYDLAEIHARRQTVTRGYVALMGRAPDAEGLAFWSNELKAGMTVPKLLETMFATEPARAIYPAGMTTQQIVEKFYQFVLGRAAGSDPQGVAHWVVRFNAVGLGAALHELITAVANYTGTDPAGAYSAQLFADKVGLGQMWGESGGGVAGSVEAIRVQP
ncbi:MAG TPA: DUF4214 domain-containing protein [Ramlibacter sp.]|nr:DUF4214 domain-containing protein [Ramlibacter sp.]